MITVTIEVEKLDDEFKVEIPEDMTLEQFKIALDKSLGFNSNLNITKYNQRKNQKVKDFFKGDRSIFLLKNENIGNVIKHWKGNFINNSNSCFRDATVQSIVHSMAEKLVEQVDNSRKNNGFPPAKNFPESNNTSSSNSPWNQLLTCCENILGKMKNNDTSPINNSFDASIKPPSQSYENGGSYPSNQLTNLSICSNSTEPPGGSGSLTIAINNNFNMSFTKDHQIFLKKRTVIGDCINIDVRSFSKCSKCYNSNISVINIGNISIIFSDFLKSYFEKSFNGLLKYFYINNNFGFENKKICQKCNKCNNFKLETYNMISTLPEILIVDLNLHNYYNNSTDSFLKEDSLYWTLQEEISLKEYYDNYSDNYYNYELTSFIGHFGSKSNGHFVNFSKIDDEWYLFDDLSKEEAIKFGRFEVVKAFIKEQYFGFKYGNTLVNAKLKICNLFYEKNKCKGYENLIKKMRSIFYKKQ